MSLSAGEMKRLKGTLTVKNVSGSPLTLTNYGAYSFAVDEELDLLDDAVPSTLQAADYSTAQNMVGLASVGKAPKHTAYELAQLVDAGSLSITSDIKPELALLKKL